MVEPHEGHSKRPSILFGALGFATIIVYLLAPAARDGLYLVIGFAGSIAIALGLRLHRPRRRGWLLIAAGVATYCVGDATYTVLAAISGSEPFPTIADALYLAGELLMLAGVAALAIPATNRLRHPALLDAGLVASALGFIVWLTILDPISAGITDPLAGLIALAYPFIDVALIGALASLVLLPGRKSPAALLLTIGVAAWLAADLAYAHLSLTGEYVSGSFVDTGWLAGYILFGAAALHPSMARLVAVAEPHEATLSNRRLALIGGAILAPIVIFVLHGPFDHPWDFIGFAAGDILVGLLGAVRLLGALHDSRLLIEQQRLLHAKIDVRARTDGLTQLANRNALIDRLSSVLVLDEPTALLFLDVDDFKRVNDAFGHPIGDRVLCEVANRLRAIVKRGDDVARLGGDEFAIVVAPSPTRASAVEAAERALKAFIPDVVIDGRLFRIRPSIGVVWARPGELTADEVLSRADIAMYLAKERGDHSFELFEPAMHDRAVELTQLRGELEGAVRRGEIEPWYQPIFDSRLQLVAVEALARWRHPRRGLVSPDEFIPLAELSGDIVAIDRAMVAMATRDVARWNSAGRSLLLHVNIAPREAADPLTIRSVEDALRASGLPASQLVIEMTETALVDAAIVAPVLEQLKDLGVRLSIDDFGSQYAVLAHLGRLPFDIVKIDRSLVLGAETPEGYRLLHGIVRLAESLRLETIAEGVETTSGLTVLRRLGCTAFQGFVLGRPMPASDLAWQVEQSESAAASA